MQCQHKARETTRKEQNRQQQDDTHFAVIVAHDHERHQQNICRNADGRQQIFGHEYVRKGAVGQDQG